MTKSSFYSYLFLLIGVVLSLNCGNSYAEDATPWWVQSYSQDSESATRYYYGPEGEKIQASQTVEGQLNFRPRTAPSVNNLPENLRTAYRDLEQYVTAHPDSTSEQRLTALGQTFTAINADDLSLVVQLYEFTTATGQYAFLTQAPTEEDVSLYDSWFHFFAAKYPQPPATIDELNTRKEEAVKTLALQSSHSEDDIRTLLSHMEYYIDKFDLNRNVPLSQALQEKSARQ